MKTFQSPNTDKIVSTSNRAEIKKYRACGWKEIKDRKPIFIKGHELYKTKL